MDLFVLQEGTSAVAMPPVLMAVCHQ